MLDVTPSLHNSLHIPSSSALPDRKKSRLENKCFFLLLRPRGEVLASSPCSIPPTLRSACWIIFRICSFFSFVRPSFVPTSALLEARERELGDKGRQFKRPDVAGAKLHSASIFGKILLRGKGVVGRTNLLSNERRFSCMILCVCMSASVPTYTTPSPLSTVPCPMRPLPIHFAERATQQKKTGPSPSLNTTLPLSESAAAESESSEFANIGGEGGGDKKSSSVFIVVDAASSYTHCCAMLRTKKM